NQGFPGWLLRRVGAITPQGSDTRAVEDTLLRAGEALDRGEVICLFAEGCRPADGDALPFARIYEQAVSNRSVPAVPVSLHQPHGSIIGMNSGKYVRRMPAEIPSPVWICFGAPLPPGTPAIVVRQALQETSARLAIDRSPY